MKGRLPWRGAFYPFHNRNPSQKIRFFLNVSSFDAEDRGDPKHSGQIEAVPRCRRVDIRRAVPTLLPTDRCVLLPTDRRVVFCGESIVGGGESEVDHIILLGGGESFEGIPYAGNVVKADGKGFLEVA